MLRDLDKRNAPERAPDYIDASSSQSRQSMIEPQKNSKLGILVLVSVFVIAGAWLSWGYFVTPIPVVSEVERLHQKSDASEAPVPREAILVLDKTKKVELVSSVEPKPAQSVISAPKRIEVPVINTVVNNAVNSDTVQIEVEQKSSSVSKPRIETLIEKVDTNGKLSHLSQVAPVQAKKSPSIKVKVPLSPESLDKQTAETALAMYRKGEARQAYRILYDFIGNHDYDTKSRIILASQLIQETRLAEAGDVILGSDTQAEPQLRQLKARWLEAKGDSQAAIDTLSSALPRIEKHPGYYVLLASYYQRFGHAEKAVDTYTKLVQFDEQVADWWAGLALSSDMTKQGKQAKFAYQQALSTPGLDNRIVKYAQQRLLELSQ